MGSRASLVAFVVEQLGDAVTARPMFGEYGIYRAGTLIGLMCDDRLFLKPTATARTLLGQVEEAPPYPGAKPAFVVPEDRWDDAELMGELAKVTALEIGEGAEALASTLAIAATWITRNTDSRTAGRSQTEA